MLSVCINTHNGSNIFFAMCAAILPSLAFQVVPSIYAIRTSIPHSSLLFLQIGQLHAIDLGFNRIRKRSYNKAGEGGRGEGFPSKTKQFSRAITHTHTHNVTNTQQAHKARIYLHARVSLLSCFQQFFHANTTTKRGG